MYSVRINSREFERVNGRSPNCEEEKQMVIDTFKEKIAVFGGDREGYEDALKDTLTMVDAFNKGEMIETTNDSL